MTRRKRVFLIFCLLPLLGSTVGLVVGLGISPPTELSMWSRFAWAAFTVSAATMIGVGVAYILMFLILARSLIASELS